jgi:pimeloyl-ACP methyl ester carboxylesterase
MGGAIAMHLALAGPSALSGLVLVGTGAKLAVLPAILDGILKEKEKTCRMIIDYVFSPKAPVPMKEASYDEYVKTDAAVIHADFTACNGFDVRASLKDIDLPTLILCGTDDRMTPPRYAEYLRDHIGGSSLRLIGDAGHMPMVEQPGGVSEAIAAFASAVR